MLRSICVSLLLSTLLAVNIAHAHPPETPAYPNLEFEKDKFTWDEFYEENASDRYEQNLNDCIAQDVLARGIGRRCTQIPYNFCPDTAPDDMKNPRGANRMMSCVSHFTHYWEDRLEIVYADLIDHYESVDRDKPTEKQRAPQLIALQTIWHDWRDAKCQFWFDGRDHFRWLSVEYETCRYNLMAVRVLELEHLYRILSY